MIVFVLLFFAVVLFILLLFIGYIVFCIKYIVTTFPGEPRWFNAIRNTIKLLMIASFIYIIYCGFYVAKYNPSESPFYDHNFEGYTTLHEIFGENDEDISRLLRLIKKGGEVNAQENYWGNAPLHCQMKYLTGYTASQILVDNGADLNIQNKEGKTPIHILLETFDDNLRRNVAVCDTDKLLRFVAGNKFDVNIKDNQGTSVFDLLARSELIKSCPEAVQVIKINDKRLNIQTFAYNSSGELIYYKDSAGKTVSCQNNSEEKSEELSADPTESNTIENKLFKLAQGDSQPGILTESRTIEGLRQAISQNNYTIEYQLLGVEPLPKSEPIYKNPEDRPKPFWLEKFLGSHHR
jgi:hypothetical protein